MDAIKIIQSRIDVIKVQQGNETNQQNIQMMEYAILQLERMIELIEIECK